jgi:hypothetical protein
MTHPVELGPLFWATFWLVNFHNWTVDTISELFN